MPPTLRLSPSSSLSLVDEPSSYSVRSLGTGFFHPHHDDDEKIEFVEANDEQQSPSYAPSCAPVVTTNTTTTSSSDDNVDSIGSPGTLKKQPCLGGEPTRLGTSQAEERKGVALMLEALDEQEVASMPDDAMPIRHLRAENGNVHKAIEKLKAALRWRQGFDVDRIIHSYSSSANDDNGDVVDPEMQSILQEENATGKIYVRGYDTQGRAIMYMRPGRENTNNELNNMRHLVWNLEKAIACTARKSVQVQVQKQQQQQQQHAMPAPSAPLEKIILIIDYDGFSLKEHAPPLSTSKYTLDILQKHYPERMHRAYVLNAPRAFSIFWTIIKPFVDPATKQRIVFLNTNNTGSKKMTPLVDAVGGQYNLDQLEPCAGGTASKEFHSTEYLRLPFCQSFDE